MSEQKRIKRLFGIYHRLKRGAMTIDSLHTWCKAQDIHVSARTLYRDIEDISNYFHHKDEELLIWQGEFNKTYWRIVKREDATPDASIAMQDQMTEALIISGALSSLPVKDLFGESYNKAIEYLLEKQNSKSFPIQSLQQHVIHTHWGESQYAAKHKKYIHDVIWSIENQRYIELEYFENTIQQKKNQHLSEIFLPRKIVCHRGGLYIMLQKHDLIFFIDIESIRSLTISSRYQEKADTIPDIQEVLKQRFGISGHQLPIIKLRIQFHGIATLPSPFWHTKNWHPTQKIIKGKNGAYILEMQCALSEELISWILSCMDYAEVISPPELKEYVLLKAVAILSRYQNQFPGNASSTQITG
jgi:hypothetical protein